MDFSATEPTDFDDAPIAPETPKRKKSPIREIVAENIDELRAMSTHKQLFDWARAHGIDSAAGFASFKKTLLVGGIDYEAMRASVNKESAAERESAATHVVTLYSDAKAKYDRFGITSANGNPVWFGRFFSDDREYNGEQSSGELAAAKKAVWLASKVKETIGATAIRLELHVDAEWLCYANGVEAGEKSGGKARTLAYAAQRLGVVLNVVWVKGTENPADKFTTCAGFKKWQDNDLAALAKPIERMRMGL